MKIYDVLILGAGASGLMCAGNLGKKVNAAIIDVNEKPAKKLKISGGGKCNITNVSVELNNFDGNHELLANVFKKYSRDNLLDFLDRNRVELELRKGRYYFCKKSSDDIINVLKRNAKNAEMILNEKIIEVTKNEDIFEVLTDKRSYKAKKVVVATGGESFKTLGASAIGIEIAKSFDLQVKSFTPALVGLTVQKEQFWMKELSGTSLPVRIGVGKHLLEGDLLFTHKGISGPAVLDASLYWEKGSIEVDFAPHISLDREFFATKKQLSTRLGLPKRFSKAFLQHIGLCDMPAQKLSHAQRKLLTRIKSYAFAPAGNFGYGKAEVTKGGIATDEIDPASMQSKHVPGLYFLGECLDVTGRLGGYNFQWAFATAQRLKL